MKVRHKSKGHIGEASKFNAHGLGEMIVGFFPPECEFYDMDSDYIKDYDMYIDATGEWKDASQAFKDHDVIVDNYNTHFFEPTTPEDRGYTLN